MLMNIEPGTVLSVIDPDTITNEIPISQMRKLRFRDST